MKLYQNPICLFVALSAEDLIRTSGATGLKNAGVGNANNLQQGYSFNDFINPES